VVQSCSIFCSIRSRYSGVTRNFNCTSRS